MINTQRQGITMPKKSLFLILVILITASLCQAEITPEQTVAHNNPGPLEAARTYTQSFYDGNFDQLHEQFSQTMKNAMPIESLAEFHGRIAQHFGSETQLITELFDPAVAEYNVYKRVAQFDNTQTKVMLVWVLDSDLVISGFNVSLLADEAETKYLEYETQAELILPFEDEWLVFWGGRSVLENYHAAYLDQRFAYDFLQSKNGKTHMGAGDSNEDYFCFGKTIMAPARGTIVAVENNIPDNVPGEMNPGNPLGNYVIIDHGNDEYSFLAHFKQHSISVEVGEKVLQAQKLGLCGNSGNSSEAHLHYHLQNTAAFGKGEGLPAPFNYYMHKGNFIESGEPTRGQQVSNHAAH